MLIAVNTRMLQLNKMEGIGYFAYESFRRITKQHPEHEFIFIFDRPYDSSFIFSENITPVVLSPPARHPILWLIWYEWSLHRFLKKINPDLFVATDGYLALRPKVKSLAVIHDLNFEHYPGDLPFFNRTYYRHFFPKFAKKASRIATVSRFSRNDIANTYKIQEEKIDVVYNGAGDMFKPASEQLKEKTRAKYTSGKNYLLFVGSLHQRKNIASLLRSFDAFKTQSDSDFKLVLAGSKRWWTSDMEKAYNEMKYRADVIFTGRVPDDELVAITASAYCMVYVSVFEGFGIPIAEAFRCNIPVICSDITSMPEVAGDAAVYVNPFSVEDITRGMLELYKNPGLYQDLIKRGKSRMHLYNWDKTAGDLWSSMMKTIST